MMTALTQTETGTWIRIRIKRKIVIVRVRDLGGKGTFPVLPVRPWTVGVGIAPRSQCR